MNNTGVPPNPPEPGIGFLAGLDRDLRSGLANEFRALWTHHSTALEGNSLTLGDTTFVLQEGLTVQGKPLKDHQEVVGHARAIDLLYQCIGSKNALDFAGLHQLHRAVQSEVVMDIFQPVGRWKVEPNGTTALLSDDRTQWHDYAQPEHVPAWMEQWLTLLAQPAPNVLEAYTDLHLGFTTIHPYADGNGRMARLLANLPVISGGLPPLLVPRERRRTYIQLLGDWSIARGAPLPGHQLLPRLPAWVKLRDFFAEVWQPSRDLVESYRARQQARDTRAR